MTANRLMWSLAALILISVMTATLANAGVTIHNVNSPSLLDREAASAEREHYAFRNKDNSEHCKTPRGFWGCKFLKEGAVLPRVLDGRSLYFAAKRGNEAFIAELAHQNKVSVEEFHQFMLRNSANDINPLALHKDDLESIQEAIVYFKKLIQVGFTAEQIMVLLSLDDRYSEIETAIEADGISFSIDDLNIKLSK